MLSRHVYLYADDSDTNRELFGHAFRRSGVDKPLVMVSSGEETLKYLHGEEPFSDRAQFPLPSLLLLDLYMPRLSGIETLRRIRSDEQFRNLIVVLFTGSNAFGDISHAFAEGANSCIEKPMEFGRLIETVRLLDLYWFGCNLVPELAGAPSEVFAPSI